MQVKQTDNRPSEQHGQSRKKSKHEPADNKILRGNKSALRNQNTIRDNQQKRMGAVRCVKAIKILDKTNDENKPNG